MFTVFYVLGLLKRAVFIDLAQIDQSSARGLDYVLLSIKLIYLSFFKLLWYLGMFRGRSVCYHQPNTNSPYSHTGHPQLKETGPDILQGSRISFSLVWCLLV